ncbi:MAG TPA: glycosyl transferase [Gammaproteobacteria bacterium]|nr:glycosyl transferase [Gammaproteobacteria bacterium]
MAVEMLSGRILAPNFGNSIHVWGAIITLFMLALSVGYLLGGWWSVHQPSLRRLALILIIAAIATLPVIIMGDATLDWIFEKVHDPRYGSLLASTLLFFIPTVVSGMVSPYAVRLLVAESRLSGQFAGQLYFVSTFGSAAGTLLTSFYLVLYFEIQQVIAGLIGVSLMLGALTLLLGPATDESR